MATFAPSSARRLAIAAPMPREPPVTSAIFPSKFFDIVLLLYAFSRREICPSGMSLNCVAGPAHSSFTPSDAVASLSSQLERYFVSSRAMLWEYVGNRAHYSNCVVALRRPKPKERLCVHLWLLLGWRSSAYERQLHLLRIARHPLTL